MLFITICDYNINGDIISMFTTHDRTKAIDYLKAVADTQALIRDIARIHVEILDGFSRGDRIDWFAERFELDNFPTADEYLGYLFDNESYFRLGGYTISVYSEKDD